VREGWCYQSSLRLPGCEQKNFILAKSQDGRGDGMRTRSKITNFLLPCEPASSPVIHEFAQR
jgi:hypothetical protein